MCEFGSGHGDDFVYNRFIPILPWDRWVHLAGNFLQTSFLFLTQWLWDWRIVCYELTSKMNIRLEHRLVRRWIFGLVIGFVKRQFILSFCIYPKCFASNINYDLKFIYNIVLLFIPKSFCHTTDHKKGSTYMQFSYQKTIYPTLLRFKRLYIGTPFQQVNYTS